MVRTIASKAKGQIFVPLQVRELKWFRPADTAERSIATYSHHVRSLPYSCMGSSVLRMPDVSICMQAAIAIELYVRRTVLAAWFHDRADSLKREREREREREK